MIALDPASCIAHVNGGQVQLSRGEARILAVLLAAGGRVVSAQGIADAIYPVGHHPSGPTEAVRARVYLMRGKFTRAGCLNVIGLHSRAGYFVDGEVAHVRVLTAAQAARVDALLAGIA